MIHSFICDMHIPPRLAKWLRTQGFDAIHALDLGFGTADDAVIADYAKQHGAIVVTKDRDFVRLATSCPDLRLILVCTGNCGSRQLVNTFSRLLPDMLGHIEAGKYVVELR